MTTTGVPPPRIAPFDTYNPPANTNAEERSFDNLSRLEKRAKSWKHHGYDELTTWMASSNDLFVLRKHSKAAARTLLYLQNEIVLRERALEKWDHYAMRQQATPEEVPLGCNSFASDKLHQIPRDQLLQELAPLLQSYYDLVNSFSEMKSRPSAQDQQVQNVKNFFKRYPGAVEQSEQEYIQHDGDLVSIVARQRTPLRRLLEKWRLLRFRFKVDKRADRVDAPDEIVYTSDLWLDIFVNSVILFTGLIMLFIPMWWLNWVSDDTYRLAIITASVTLFTCWLWSAAGQRPFEILLGTAAYTAVLMVFLQMDGSS